MTGPAVTPVLPEFDDLYPKDSVQTKEVRSDLPNFDDLYTTSDKGNQHLNPRIRGLLSGVDALIDLSKDIGALSIGKVEQEIVGAFSPTLKGDIVARRTHIEEQMGKAHDNLAGFKDDFKKDPLEATKSGVGGLVRGLLYEPLKDALKTMTGLDPEKPSHYEVHMTRFGPEVSLHGTDLTDDQVEEATKQTTANVVAYVVGEKVTKSVAEMFTGMKPFIGGKGITAIGKATSGAEIRGVISGADLDVGKLYDLAKSGVFSSMPWVQRGLSGVAGGAAGGFAYGYVGAPPEDRLSAALTMAVVAAPLGVAFTTIGEIVRVAKGRPVDSYEIAKNLAGEMARVRELNGLIDKAPLEVLNNMDNVQQLKSTQAAMARIIIDYDVAFDPATGQMVTQGKNAGVVPAVEGATIHEVLSQLDSEPGTGRPEVVSVIHAREDGLHDILIAPTDTPQPIQDFFAKTGFMQGQQVTYGGSDRWVITDTVQGKGKPKLTLRNMVTEQHIEGVGLHEVIRPQNKYMGELALYQTRQITQNDLFDPAQGIARGPNDVRKEFASRTQLVFNSSDVDGTAMSLTGYMLDDAAAPTKFIATPFTDVSQPREVPLKPGINELRNVKDNLTHGVSVFVASDGTLGGIVGYTETPRASGGSPIRRVSDAWHFQGGTKEIRMETTLAMAKYRAENKLLVSNSSMSIHAQRAALRRLNENWFGRKYTEFGVYDKTAFLQDLITSFLDHVAFFDDNIHIAPEEVVERIGTSRRSGRSAVTGVGETLETIARAREGYPEYESYVTNPQRVTGVTYRTKTSHVASEKLAGKFIANEVAAGHVSEVSSRPSAADRVTVTSDMTFKDLFDSWKDGLRLKPEVEGLLMNHLEFEFGRLLTGTSDTLRKYTNKITATTWRARVNDINKALELQDKMLRDNTLSAAQDAQLVQDVRDHLALDPDTSKDDVWQAVEDSKRTKAIFEARIAQLEKPIPLELTEPERVKIQELKDKALEHRKESANELLAVAHSNGFYVDRGHGGAIEIRDMDTHQLLPARFLDEATATQWIKDTGGVTPKDIDGGNGNLIPPEAVGGGLMPPPGQGPPPHAIPYEFPPDTKLGKYMELLDTLIPRLTTKRGYFTAVDGNVGTKFYEEMYQPLQTAKMLSMAKKRPFFERLKLEVEEILDKAGIDRKGWGRINDYRETMSVNQIDQHQFGDRVPNQAEKEMSQKLADMNIDVAKVYKYNRDIAQVKEDARIEVAKLDPQAPDTQQKAQEIEAKVAETMKSVSNDLGMDPDHMNAAKMFEFAKTQSHAEFRLDIATRRARSILSKELSREGFAKHHKMHPAEIQAATALDGLYNDALREAGLSTNFMDYVNHNRVEGEAVKLGVNLKDSKLLRAAEKETADLADKLSGTGEINNGQRDPVHGAINFLNKVLDHGGFDSVWNNARTSAIKHLKAMPEASREYASRIVGEYLYGMKGVPNAHDQYSKAMVTTFFEDIGAVQKGKPMTPAQEHMITDVSDVILASTSAALLGGRPAQGIRDLHGFMRNYWARMGTARLANAFRLAFERDATGKLPLYYLAEQGKIPGLSILQFLSEQEVAEAQAGRGNHTIRDAFFKASKIGLVTSGQHNVYALAHAMAYLETGEFAGKQLLKLSRGETTKKAAYKALKLDTYDLPVAEGFDNLVTQGKFDEAREYIAQATGTETAFVYGLQNQPYGWGSKSGRLMGQFGQWPVWDRDFLFRLASRGTASQRAAAMARYATAEAMLWTAGKATGFNVKSWYGVPGILFAGSPLMGLMGQFSDMIGLRGKQRQREATTVYGGKIPVISQFVPGASAFSDYYQAYQLYEKRYGPVPLIGKALGFSVDRSQRSWLDRGTNQFPQQNASR